MQEKFLTALAEALEVEGREITMSDKFKEFEEWDSLTRLSLIAMLDEEYGKQIEQKDFEQIETVGDLYQIVQG